MNKSEKIKELLKIGKKPSFIAKQVGVPVQTVYQTKYLMNKALKATKPTLTVNAKRKRGRPRKDAFKQSGDQQEQVRKLVSDNLKLMDDNRTLMGRIDQLTHQVIGFRAVISYLENQVGLRNSQ